MKQTTILFLLLSIATLYQTTYSMEILNSLENAVIAWNKTSSLQKATYSAAGAATLVGAYFVGKYAYNKINDTITTVRAYYAVKNQLQKAEQGVDEAIRKNIKRESLQDTAFILKDAIKELAKDKIKKYTSR